MGETFRFGGMLSFISTQLTSLLHPSWTRTSASLRQAAAASGVSALAWAPFAIAASILWRDHFSPQSTGQPSTA